MTSANSPRLGFHLSSRSRLWIAQGQNYGESLTNKEPAIRNDVNINLEAHHPFKLAAQFRIPLACEKIKGETFVAAVSVEGWPFNTTC
jgi:hypothetical protein